MLGGQSLDRGRFSGLDGFAQSLAVVPQLLADRLGSIPGCRSDLLDVGLLGFGQFQELGHHRAQHPDPALAPGASPSTASTSEARELAKRGFRQENRRQCEDRDHHASYQDPSRLCFA